MAKKFFKGSTLLNPVPVVLITSLDEGGKSNVFTAAWVGNACTKPPIISVAIKPERLSYKYIKERKEFTVNLPTKELVRTVDFCGVKSGTELDKIKATGLTLEPGEKIATPSIKECPISLECKLINIIELGSHHLFLGEIVSVRVEHNLIDEKGKIDLKKADLICYSHGEYFPISSKAIGSFGFSVRKK